MSIRVFEGRKKYVSNVNGSCDPLCFCLCWQVAGQSPVLSSLSDMVLRAHAIPVRLEPLDQLEVLVSEVKAWKESATKTFLVKNSPFTLLEVRLDTKLIGNITFLSGIFNNLNRRLVLK